MVSLKKKMKFACNRYFSSMSTENDNSSSFFTTSALKCTSEVNTAHWNELREEKLLFFTSQKKISLTLVKKVTIRDLHRSHKFTCYFSPKKGFMQHPQFLLHNRNLSEHLRKS